MRLPCDLEVHVNGEQTFLLSKEVLLPRCGRLLKEYRRALKAHKQRQEDVGISSVRMLLHDMPGGGRAFELVARFCYKGGWMKMDADSVALMRCAAEYLEMSEEYGAGNLLQCTDSFLSTIAFWSWKDVLILLSSCESLLPHAEKSGIIQVGVNSLAAKAKSASNCPSPDLSSNSASPNPCSESPTAKVSASSRSWRSPTTDRRLSYFNRKISKANESLLNPVSPEPSCTAPAPSSNSPVNHVGAKLWWCEDMSSLSIYMMERFVTALQTYCIHNKYIGKVLLRYLEASLSLLGYSSMSFGVEKASRNEQTLKEYAQKVQKEVFETVIRLLHRLQWASVSVKSLFELRRVSISINASLHCRQHIEEMIGCQLHRATLDNVLIPRGGDRDRRTCLYDVDLVLRLVKIFLHGEGGAQCDLQRTSDRDGKADAQQELELEYGLNHNEFSGRVQLVGALVDKYLAEIAPDAYLKASKFSELAQVLPSNARETYDHLYRALDIYLQAHRTLSTEDAIKVCRSIDCGKLSFEACKHVMENPRIPAWFSFRVLAFQQEKLRAALRTSWPCSRRLSSERISCQSVATDYDSVVKQNEELRLDLQTMQARIDELERLCKGLRSQMSQEVWLSC